MQTRVRTTKTFSIAEGSVGDEFPVPVSMTKHMFQSSVAVGLTPVLFSGADGTEQAIAAGETWETTAPLRGFKSDTAATIYYAGDIS